jgi:hypothetical protein
MTPGSNPTPAAIFIFGATEINIGDYPLWTSKKFVVDFPENCVRETLP